MLQLLWSVECNYLKKFHSTNSA